MRTAGLRAGAGPGSECGLLTRPAFRITRLDQTRYRHLECPLFGSAARLRCYVPEAMYAARM
jgi:hypothetical protein